MIREFSLTDEQVKKIEEWDKCKGTYSGTIGGRLIFSFLPTSIGTIVSVRCSKCGEELVNYDQM